MTNGHKAVPTEIPLGTVVHDEYGRAWVSFGYRLTSVHSKQWYFILSSPMRKNKLIPELPGAPPWVSGYVFAETLLKHFPDLINQPGVKFE